MNEYYPPITYIVPPEEDGYLLKTILQKRLRVSRKLLSRLKLTEHGIMLNGERVYISVKVRPGDVVSIQLEQEISEDILPQPMDLDILYEDEALLILNKRAGVIVHPTHGHYTGTLANGVVHYWAEQGVRYRFRPVHRLDQETSGVLAVAKNAYVHQHISEQMIAGQVDKKYAAIVHGRPTPSEGTVDGPIDRDPAEPHRRIVTPSGYPALTYYKVVEKYHQGSMVHLKLGSGRTHQIRVHMTWMGCPLIGDKLYSQAGRGEDEARELQSAGKLDELIDRQALHARELGFVHPLTGEYMLFTAPLPEDMEELRDALRSQSFLSHKNDQIGDKA
ncbi:RluA family pseudouridine synthase [Paenibacillus sp. CAA11]|uniref:RluA family pseudouridine synthase n=1 Tax=Paenibacillus sp. CAA11 TaxID=1532905 RepID=UPI001900ABD1|nr:RluA family pseudouridine synthase [Paenibacillus sp. CAA11]